MALQDIITNLGTAIINLVNVRISKAFTTHDSELEEILLDLKTKVDELAGSNTPDIPVTPTTEEFDINGYTGTITTLLEDDNYVTIYEFNPVLNMNNRWFRGTYDNKPDKLLLIKENDEVIEYNYRPALGSMYSGYTDTSFQITGNIKQIKLYSTTIQKINISSFSTGVMPPT